MKMKTEDKEALKVIVWTAVILGAVVLLLGSCGAAGYEEEAPRWTETVYVVQAGDTLWGLAAELGIEDWRTWSYLVQELNGLPDAGLPAGEEIVILE